MAFAPSLLHDVESLHRLGDLPLDVGDGAEDTLAGEALRVAVAELDRLMCARRSAGGHGGGAGSVLGMNADAEGRIAARVEDLERAQTFDGNHTARSLGLWPVRTLDRALGPGAQPPGLTEKP